MHLSAANTSGAHWAWYDGCRRCWHGHLHDMAQQQPAVSANDNSKVLPALDTDHSMARLHKVAAQHGNAS